MSDELTENEELALLTNVLSERPQTKDSFLVYRYRGERISVTAFGGRTLKFDPQAFGQKASPIKKRPTADCEGYCKRQRALVQLDEELGMALLRVALKKSKAGSVEPVADAWEELFNDPVPSVSQYAEDERRRTEMRRILKREHGVNIPDDDFMKMSAELLQNAVATKGRAYWEFKMNETSALDAPSPEQAMTQKAADKHDKAADPDKARRAELRGVLKDVAAQQGVQLGVGVGKEIHPAWPVNRLLDEIAKYDEQTAKVSGWKG